MGASRPHQFIAGLPQQARGARDLKELSHSYDYLVEDSNVRAELNQGASDCIYGSVSPA
jgi:hypothetical protein